MPGNKELRLELKCIFVSVRACGWCWTVINNVVFYLFGGVLLTHSHVCEFIHTHTHTHTHTHIYIYNIIYMYIYIYGNSLWLSRAHLVS